MDKILITTADGLTALAAAEEAGKDSPVSGGISKVMVFLPLEGMFRAETVIRIMNYTVSRKDIEIVPVAYKNREQVMFQLGQILSTEHEYIMTGDVAELPEYIAGMFRISTISIPSAGTGKKRKTAGTGTNAGTKKPRARQTKQGKEKLPEGSEAEVVQETLQFDTPDGQPEHPEVDAVNTDMPAAGTAPKKGRRIQTAEKESSSRQSVEGKPEETDSSDMDSAKTGQRTSAGSQMLSKGEQILKKSGLRAEDLHGFCGSDMELGQIMVELLSASSTAAAFSNAVGQQFTAEDTLEILKWTKKGFQAFRKMAL